MSGYQKRARNAVSCRQYAEVIEKGGRLTWEAVYDSLSQCFGLGTLQSHWEEMGVMSRERVHLLSEDQQYS